MAQPQTLYRWALIDKKGKNRGTIEAINAVQAKNEFKIRSGGDIPQGWKVVKRGPVTPADRHKAKKKVEQAPKAKLDLKPGDHVKRIDAGTVNVPKGTLGTVVSVSRDAVFIHWANGFGRLDACGKDRQDLTMGDHYWLEATDKIQKVEDEAVPHHKKFQIGQRITGEYAGQTFTGPVSRIDESSLGGMTYQIFIEGDEDTIWLKDGSEEAAPDNKPEPSKLEVAVKVDASEQLLSEAHAALKSANEKIGQLEADIEGMRDLSAFVERQIGADPGGVIRRFHEVQNGLLNELSEQRVKCSEAEASLKVEQDANRAYREKLEDLEALRKILREKLGVSNGESLVAEVDRILAKVDEYREMLDNSALERESAREQIERIRSILIVESMGHLDQSLSVGDMIRMEVGIKFEQCTF